ncbi:phosphoribosyltransferase [Thermoproteota archaeon]
MENSNQGKKRKAVNNSLEKLDFEIPSWKKIHRSIFELSVQIEKSNFKPDIIVGMSRGGWVPARIISDCLGNPNLANVSVEFYENLGETKSEPMIKQPISISVRNKKILLVDDVVDTGKSVKLVETHLRNNGASSIKIASVYYKPWSIVIPEYYQKETQLWIIFPWEIKESVNKILERFQGQNRTVKDIKNRLIQLGLDSNLLESFIKEE